MFLLNGVIYKIIRQKSLNKVEKIYLLKNLLVFIYFINYLIRVGLLSVSMKLTRAGPTTQDNKGEPNVSFDVQTPGVLG